MSLNCFEKIVVCVQVDFSLTILIAPIVPRAGITKSLTFNILTGFLIFQKNLSSSVAE